MRDIPVPGFASYLNREFKEEATEETPVREKRCC